MRKLKTLWFLPLAGLITAGCGDAAHEEKAASQVAAKVNSGEISVHQVNYLLQRIPGLKQEQLDRAKKQVLENLIDQELAVQEAVKAKLERDPKILESLEAARRTVLARAYLEQQFGNSGEPSPEDVKRYWTDHPELFSGRKIYRLEELGFPDSPEVAADVERLLAKTSSTTTIAAALKAKGIEVKRGVMVKPAEQIALELLPRLARQKEGEPHFYETEGRAAIITVLATKSDPLTEAQAMPIAEQFLINRQRTDQAREAIKRLRDKARIEYVGEFAKSRPQAQNGALVPGLEAKRETIPDALETEATTTMSKGIAGLK